MPASGRYLARFQLAYSQTQASQLAWLAARWEVTKGAAMRRLIGEAHAAEIVKVQAEAEVEMIEQGRQNHRLAELIRST